MAAITADAPAAGQADEFAFSDGHFDLLRRLVSKLAGIELGDSKRQLVYGRIARRIRTLELPGFDAYCDLVTRADGVEIESFLNAITTNLTSFFREDHHFEFLARTALPQLQRANAASRRIRIWSAGCSTGEEPYSIAMTVRAALAPGPAWDVEILATDIDSNVLATAAAGVYAPHRQQGIGPARLRRWFTTRDCPAGCVRVKDELRDMIRFAPLNLMEDWPFTEPFDAIFCRNVVIYFDRATQAALFERFAGVMARHGHLFIGHSESLFGSCTRFELIGRTIYRPRSSMPA